MKIVHLCMCCFYIDGYAYQENILPKLMHEDGHDVLIITSTFNFIDGKPIYEESEREYINEYGIKVIRRAYDTLGVGFLTNKLKSCKKVYNDIEKFEPDIIYVHGVCSMVNDTVFKYKQVHKNVMVLADSHADGNNSGTNFVSKNFVHRIFWKHYVQKIVPCVEMFYGVSDECTEFMISNYKIPREKVKWLPLGVILPDNDYYENRRKVIREKYSIDDSELLFVHSGKMDSKKKIIELLEAFCENKSSNIRLIIAGALLEDIKDKALELVKSDDRILFVGWLNGDELGDLLCAADVYVQPGGQSATMQNALGHSCAVLLYPHKSHKRYVQGNGRFVKTKDELFDAYFWMSNNVDEVRRMMLSSREIAEKYLDYKEQINVIFEDGKVCKK